MANELRVRGNLVSGTLSSSLTNVATSMSAAGLANLPVVDATNHAVIVIENEIVYVTAHTAGATTATIARQKDNTTAAAHNSGVAWQHGPVASDVVGVLGHKKISSNQGSITALVDLTGSSVTVNVPYAGHLARISFYTWYNGTAANMTFITTIMEGATQLLEADAFQGSSGFGCSVVGSWTGVPSIGSHTYKLQGRAIGGTGTLLASPTAPCHIIVEDLGPGV